MVVDVQQRQQNAIGCNNESSFEQKKHCERLTNLHPGVYYNVVRLLTPMHRGESSPGSCCDSSLFLCGCVTSLWAMTATSAKWSLCIKPALMVGPKACEQE